VAGGVMTIPKGARVRAKMTKKGKKVRLTFKNNKVIEAKRIKRGKTKK
jgi:hypothetical protein